jgi:hypothetical protein
VSSRCTIHLLPWLSSYPSSKEELVSPKLSSLTPVQPLQVALVVAYAAHNNHTLAAADEAIEFLKSQARYFADRAQSIKTTPREQGMLLRYVESCSSLLMPCSAGLKKKLFGPLDAKYWKLGLVVPVKPPEDEADQLKKKLKKERVCRWACMGLLVGLAEV